MPWLLANYQSVLVVLLALLESVNLVLHMLGKPNSSAIGSVISAVKGVPGVKDPQIGA